MLNVKFKKTIIVSAAVFLIMVVGFTFPHIKTSFDLDRFLPVVKENTEHGKHEPGTKLRSVIANTSINLPNKGLPVITFPCAIVISPTSQKLEKLKKENSEDEFYTIVDDNQYYIALSTQYLDSVKVRILHRNSEGSLIFKTTHGIMFEFQADSVYWGVLLFNGRAKPLKADMTDINQDFESYMSK